MELIIKENTYNPTICLNMIVKDEEAIIVDTLKNLCQHINFAYWVIADTGSTDNTKELIRNFFEERFIPGELVEHEWKDFAYNRTKSMECAFNKTDYVLIFDADDRFVGDFKLPVPFNKDLYDLKLGKGFEWVRPLLLTNKKKWYFKGVTHEYLWAPNMANITRAVLQGDYYIEPGTFGCRSKNPTKYYDDAIVLKNAFETEKNDPTGDASLVCRYAFYCAQSYKDAGAEYYPESIHWYKKVLELNNWTQEKYYSCLKLGELYIHCNDMDNALKYLLKSSEYDNDRIEGIVDAMEILRLKGENMMVNMLYHKYKKYRQPSEFMNENKLFVTTHKYNDYIEFINSVCAFYTDDKESGYECCKQIISNNKITPDIIEVTKRNMVFYEEYMNNKKEKAEKEKAEKEKAEKAEKALEKEKEKPVVTMKEIDDTSIKNTSQPKNNIRLHLPAIPYTITNEFYSHDAFTGKVQRFAPMMRSRGFEVYHYGVETSDVDADKNIELFTKAEWNELRIKTFMFVDTKLTLEEATKKNDDPTYLVNGLSNWSSPLCIEFNRRLRIKLQEHYRSTATDIVCIPLGRSYEDALSGLNYVAVETGIGYSGSYKDYRIFESYSWLSSTLGHQQIQPPNYWFVVPYFLDTNEFKLTLTPTFKKVGFFGRIEGVKGLRVIVEIAKILPDVQFVLCGQGDPKPFLTQPNIVYKPPIHGAERSEFLGSCCAILCPSQYAEPFCAVAAEAQLCGTPVICSDHGGLVESVENFRTGLRCHTLADYCKGVQMAVDNKFDRTYIRERAVNLFDMYKLAYNYEYILKTILDVHTPGVNGWYAQKSHINLPITNAITVPVTVPVTVPEQKQRIYLFIVYFGSFPNYFQLYLDSLSINKDILTVFLVTDISNVNSYSLPSNLIHIHMTIHEVRKRISGLLVDTYQKQVEPESLVRTNYKLVDFKIVYSLLFNDILVQHNVTENDFIGWGDCDVIYGKLSNFIDFKEKYDIIGGWHGHFTAIKNNDSFKNLFKKIPDYFDLVTDNSRNYLTDEIAYREPLKAYLGENNLKMFYMNAHFCDIVPECFYSLFRPNWKHNSKNFFNSSRADKNINHLFFDKIKETLTTFNDDGTNYETTYCHLQKKQMNLPFQIYKTGFYINENSFSLVDKNTNKNNNIDSDLNTIPLNIFQTWNILELPIKMNENVELLKKENPEFTHYLFDDTMCRQFISDHFKKDVLFAFDKLKPGAYKADLWRYCVLYIHGGVYLDIKLKFSDGFKLSNFIGKEYFVSDGTYVDVNNVQKNSIYNAFMVSKKNNEILMKCINHIVLNVTTNYYGISPWEVTGPQLLGNYYDQYYKRSELVLTHCCYSSEKGRNNWIEVVKYQDRVVLEFYEGYRDEQNSMNEQHYTDLWNSNKIYNDNIIRVAVLMFYDDNIKEYGDINYKINKIYCEKYNIDLIVCKERLYKNRAPHWEKLVLTLKHITKYDYVIWIDADAFFYIDSPNITNIINNNNNVNFIFSKDIANSEITKGINSGLFIVKNTKYSIDFINKWTYDEELYIKNSLNPTFNAFQEQSVLNDMYNNNILDVQKNSIMLDYGVLQHFESNELLTLSYKPYVYHMAGKDKNMRINTSLNYYNNNIKI